MTYGPKTRFCGTKQAYPTAITARAVARKLEKKERLPMKIYCCPFCAHWHIESKKQKDETRKEIPDPFHLSAFSFQLSVRVTWREKLGLI